jgi:predicted nicotinamide N-methyase
MMNQHIDNLNNKDSEAYKSTAKQVEASGYTDIPQEIENMRVNIMNNSMNIEEIINDLSNKDVQE